MVLDLEFRVLPFVFWKQISSSIWGDGWHPESHKTCAVNAVKTHFPGQHTRPGHTVMVYSNTQWSTQEKIHELRLSLDYPPGSRDPDSADAHGIQAAGSGECNLQGLWYMVNVNAAIYI